MVRAWNLQGPVKFLKIGTRSVHVGSLSEVSQDTPNYNCTLLSIVTMLNTLHDAILQVMLKPRPTAMLCLMYAKGLFLSRCMLV